jgi:dGTP triphosphohydrolase
MLEKQREEVVKLLSEAKEAGALTVTKIKEIVSNAVSVVKSDKDNEHSDEEILKRLMLTVVETLKKFKEASQENISAAAHGLFDGVKNAKDVTLDQISKRTQFIQHGAGSLFHAIEDVASNVSNDVKGFVLNTLRLGEDETDEVIEKLQDSVGKDIRRTIRNKTLEDELETAIETTLKTTYGENTPLTNNKIKDYAVATLVVVCDEAEQHKKKAQDIITNSLRGMVTAINSSIDDIEARLASDEETPSEDFGNSEDMFVEIIHETLKVAPENSRTILVDLALDKEDNVFGFTLQFLNELKSAIFFNFNSTIS